MQLNKEYGGIKYLVWAIHWWVSLSLFASTGFVEELLNESTNGYY
jgi:hypothetical protein